MGKLMEDEIENFLKRIYKLESKGSSSLSPSELYSQTAPSINLENLIQSEIQKQLGPIRETQNTLINEVAEISTTQTAINQEINNLRNVYFQNFQLKKRVNNINTLLSFKKFHSNWNGEGAEPFSENLIQKVLDFINSPLLKYQPSIFPTARQSIQLEYEKSNGNYLEAEIYENENTAYREIDDQESEYPSISFNEIINLVNEFYSRI
jgi:hypothetical protein